MSYQSTQQRAKYQNTKERNMLDPICYLILELGDEKVSEPVVYIRQSKSEASKS